MIALTCGQPMANRHLPATLSLPDNTLQSGCHFNFCPSNDRARTLYSSGNDGRWQTANRHITRQFVPRTACMKARILS